MADSRRGDVDIRDSAGARFLRTNTPRGHEPTNVDRVDSDIRLVAGIDHRRQFGLTLGCHWKASRKENEAFRARNRRKVLGHAAQREHNAVRAEVGLSAAERAHWNSR